MERPFYIVVLKVMTVPLRSPLLRAYRTNVLELHIDWVGLNIDNIAELLIGLRCTHALGQGSVFTCGSVGSCKV